MKFADEVKIIRQKCLLSQEAFAKELGVSFATVNRWEKGKNQPTYKALRIIKEYCEKNNVDFNLLLNGNSSKTFYSNNDKLEFIYTTIEPTYECFEQVIQVKLNDNYIYQPVGVSVAPYKHELVQKGVFRTKEDTINFLNSYFSNKELTSKQDLEKEREVA